MKRKENFLLRNVAGQDILVTLGSKVIDMNGVVILNTSGAYLWELLAKDTSVEDLVDAVVNRFDIDYAHALADTKVFLDEVTSIGLIES